MRTLCFFCAAAMLAQNKQQPDFFDPPSFVVAGVTDASARGGHGSDVILSSAETLTKETAALGDSASDKDALEAIHELQRLAEKEPTEPHLFAWGAKLLEHRATEQSAEVFSKAHRLFPRSSRILLGLGVSHYARGAYDEAQSALFAAADVDPKDPKPYLFLGQTLKSPIGQAAGTVQRLRRFASLHPDDARANYYAGLADAAKARPLFEKAVSINPQLSGAWLQLGILAADEGNLPSAVTAWQRAATGSSKDADVIEAHYRLAQTYRRTGRDADAKRELETYDQLSKQSAAEKEQQRAHVQEFVFK